MLAHSGHQNHGSLFWRCWWCWWWDFFADLWQCTFWRWLWSGYNDGRQHAAVLLLLCLEVSWELVSTCNVNAGLLHTAFSLKLTLMSRLTLTSRCMHPFPVGNCKLESVRQKLVPRVCTRQAIKAHHQHHRCHCCHAAAKLPEAATSVSDWKVRQQTQRAHTSHQRKRCFQTTCTPGAAFWCGEEISSTNLGCKRTCLGTYDTKARAHEAYMQKHNELLHEDEIDLARLQAKHKAKVAAERAEPEALLADCVGPAF